MICPLIGICQDLPIVDEKIIYEKIYDIPNATKEKIYGASKKFIGINFKSSQDVVQSEDPITGLIICKGNVDAYQSYDQSWWGARMVGGTFHFTMQFDIKDNKVRLRIFDIHTKYASTYSTQETSLETQMFKEAKSVNQSKGKTKEKRLEKFNQTTQLLNSTFYSLMEGYYNAVKESVNDDW